MKRLVLLVLVLSGCHKIKVDPEFSKIKKQTYDRFEEPISIVSEYGERTFDIPDVHALLQRGLSREDAVKIALMNNPSLRAEFENLGIAKSDLAQAGLYTNPSINSVFYFPTREGLPGTAQTNIETTAVFRLSDLWQVPLSKNVSEDLLEIVSLRILNSIVDLIAHTKIAYDECLAAQLRCEMMERLMLAHKELYSEICYRKQYGYTNDFDIHQADVQLAAQEVALLQVQVELQNAFVHLKQLLGITPTDEPLLLVGAFHENVVIPQLSELENRALVIRPEIKIAQVKIQQYKDAVRLERAKNLKTVDLGIGFKQDFDAPIQGWGGYFSFDLPIFDTNYAQVSRARFLYDQAQKELLAAQVRTKEELAIPYQRLQKTQHEIARYTKSILPANQKAVDFAIAYAQTMQMTAVSLYQAQIKLYEDQLELIAHLLDLRKSYARLERVVGEKIDFYDAKETA